MKNYNAHTAALLSNILPRFVEVVFDLGPIPVTPPLTEKESEMYSIYEEESLT